MTLNVGDVAPDFDLNSTTGDRIKLSDLRGEKVLIMFFPFAFTGTCTAELCAMRDSAPDYSELDAKVVSISCDAMPSLKAFAAAEGFTHPLLSDFYPHGETAKAYGVFLEDKGAANRGSFILDRQGRIAWTVTTSLGEARSNDDYRMILGGID